MFFKRKREKSKRLENYSKIYEKYLESGVDTDIGEYSDKINLVEGPYGNIFYLDLGSKIDIDLNETIRTQFFEGEINSATAGRIYLNFREQDFLEKHDVVYYGFIVDSNGLRELSLNLPSKDLFSILDMKSYIRHSLEHKENLEHEENIEL